MKRSLLSVLQIRFLKIQWLSYNQIKVILYKSSQIGKKCGKGGIKALEFK